MKQPKEMEEFDYERLLMVSGAMDLYGLDKETAEILTNDVRENFIPKSSPMGVSEWKNIGKRYGYWNYFRKDCIPKSDAKKMANAYFKVCDKRLMDEITRELDAPDCIPKSKVEEVRNYARDEYNKIARQEKRSDVDTLVMKIIGVFFNKLTSLLKK